MQTRNMIWIGIGVFVLALLAAVVWMAWARSAPRVDVQVVGPILVTGQTQVRPDAVFSKIREALSTPLQAFIDAIDHLARSIIDAFNLPAPP